MTDKEIKELVSQVIMDNLDQFASSIVNKLKTIQRLKPEVPTKESKDQFVREYMWLCEAAFKTGGWYKKFKTPEGTVLVDVARKYFGYKPITYSGDIFSTIYKAYCRVNNLERNYRP
jgi:hypothetical protein